MKSLLLTLAIVVTTFSASSSANLTSTANPLKQLVENACALIMNSLKSHVDDSPIAKTLYNGASELFDDVIAGNNPCTWGDKSLDLLRGTLNFFLQRPGSDNIINDILGFERNILRAMRPGTTSNFEHCYSLDY